MLNSTQIAIACCVLAWAASATLVDAAERPNILWFVIDDMSANFTCYGETTIKTPHAGVRGTNNKTTTSGERSYRQFRFDVRPGRGAKGLADDLVCAQLAVKVPFAQAGPFGGSADDAAATTQDNGEKRPLELLNHAALASVKRQLLA